MLTTLQAAPAADNDSTATPHRPRSENAFLGYSGGMMLHLGYQFGQGCGFPGATGEEQTLRSITYGIGGAMRIHLFQHYRVGVEGFVSTMPLRSQGDGSNIRMGWGGALADIYTTHGRWQYFAGASIGGGAQRATHVFSDPNTIMHNPDSWKDVWDDFKENANDEATYPAEFTKRGFFVLDPYIGAEYALTDHVHLIIRADYLVCAHRKQFLTPSGPRIYMGFMFTH